MPRGRHSFYHPHFIGEEEDKTGVSAIYPVTPFTVTLNTLYCPDLFARMLPPQDLKLMKAAVIITISLAPSKCQYTEIIICRKNK